MKTIRYAFWAVVAVCLITVGLANRGIVTLRALPETISSQLGLSATLEMPLFVVIFLGVSAGLLIGFFWEWIREHKYRSEARSKSRETENLQREVERLRAGQARASASGKDDILALLENPSR